jgi:hypothetical protein
MKTLLMWMIEREAQTACQPILASIRPGWIDD